jgi:hypothetical protein
MRNMRRNLQVLSAIVVSLLTLVTASGASANCRLNGTKCIGRIASIWHYTTSAENFVLLYFEGADTTGLTCDRQVNGTLEGKAVRLDMNTDSRRAAYSAVLASYLAGESLQIRTTSSGQCTVTSVSFPMLPP